MRNEKILFSAESVTEGHPDKVCDQISDRVLDEVIRQDPASRVACETFVTVGLVIVGGEITTRGWVDIQQLVRNMIKDIGYTHARYGFDYKTCSILNAIGRQSGDIAQGVDTGGAGDQGLMIGYACQETPELMPLPIMLAHRLTRRLAQVRKEKILGYIGPDGKSQITIEYQGGRPAVATRVVIAIQHTEEVLDRSGEQMSEEARQQIREVVIVPILEGFYDPVRTCCFINTTGKFLVGGPQSDTGMTGRKIIVDTYGGAVPHGGGAFSGKDPTKVDRSASYMARYIAKNMVAAGVATRCEVQLTYAIGLAEPLSFTVETFGTSKVSREKMIEAARKIFPLHPAGIIKELDLLRPIYTQTASYGHFGREEPDFTWEKKDRVEELRAALRL